MNNNKMNNLTIRKYFLIVFSLILGISTYNAQAQGATPHPVQPAMGDPLPGLTEEQTNFFIKGKEAFEAVHEGTGPIKNDEACVKCHAGPVGGASIIISTDSTVLRFGHLDPDGETFDPLEDQGGSVLQKEGRCVGIDGLEYVEEVPPEANVTADRISIMTFGTGLIEAIKDTDIEAHASDPVVTTGGKPNWVIPLEAKDGVKRVGRFGWKAQHATLLSFTADALNTEQGVTTDLLPLESQPNRLPGDFPCDDGVPDPDDQPDEDGDTALESIAGFMRFLAPPPQTPKSGMRGEILFESKGCAQCHFSSYMTPENTAIPVLSNKVVKAYSDFLVHDMGERDPVTLFGGDGIAQGEAGPRHMRTAPLWGLTSHFGLMHNSVGRGDQNLPFFNLEELLNNPVIFESRVIAAHNRPGSEAQSSAQQFIQLSANEKQDILTFLKSLGRREFDFALGVIPDETVDPAKYDNLINFADYKEFYNCYKNSGQGFFADDYCAVGDVDQDGAVGVIDAASFQTVFTYLKEDCIKECVARELAFSPFRDPDEVLSSCSSSFQCRDYKPFWLSDCQYDGREDFLQIFEENLDDVDYDTIPDQCGFDLNWDSLMSNGADVSECSGRIYFQASVSSDVPIDQGGVDLFYSFSGGPGKGAPFGDAFYLNIPEHQVYGSMRKFFDRYTIDNGEITPPPGATHISFQAGALNGGTHSKKSLVETFEIKWPDRFNTFIRGNSNAVNNVDQNIDISDALYILQYLFTQGPKPPCLDSADVNDDGSVDISDPLRLLLYLFAVGSPPPNPFPQAGFDPTRDDTECWEEFEFLCRWF